MAKIIGYGTIDFLSKNNLSLNIFSTREDSTVKKLKNVCREVLLEKI